MDANLIRALVKVAAKAYILPPARPRRSVTVKPDDEQGKARAFGTKSPMNRQLPGEYGVKVRKPPQTEKD